MKDSVILLLMSTPGKMLRVVVGLVVIGVGILIIQGTAQYGSNKTNRSRNGSKNTTIRL